jgi:hypothetical protein
MGNAYSIVGKLLSGLSTLGKITYLGNGQGAAP